MHDIIYRWVCWETDILRDVGIRADGSLHNPHGYPEANVRAAIKAAEERRQQQRCAAAQKASVTRTRRREKRVIETARRIATDHDIGERHSCAICGEMLSYPESMRRGIGPECWQDVLTILERATAEPAVRYRHSTD